MKALGWKDYMQIVFMVLPLVIVLAMTLADLWYTAQCKAAGYDSGTTSLAGAVCFDRIVVPLATALAPMATPTR